METITHRLFKTEKEIEDLLEKFIEKSLPKEGWTHEAHLTAAIWHLKQFEYYEALCLIKSRIISYNLAAGGVNDSNNGYHETITVFWMKVIYFYVNNNKTKSLLNLCNEFLSSQLSSRSLPNYFYDKEKLMSPKFRSIFMESKKAEFDYAILGKILRKEIELKD